MGPDALDDEGQNPAMHLIQTRIAKRAAARVFVPAAAKVRRNPRHVALALGPQAHGDMARFGFLQKHGHPDRTNGPGIVDEVFHILNTSVTLLQAEIK